MAWTDVRFFPQLAIRLGVPGQALCLAERNLRLRLMRLVVKPVGLGLPVILPCVGSSALLDHLGGSYVGAV